MVNDRWGMLTPCLHGGYLTCNDRYNPGVLQPRKWENSMTIDKVSYGYRRNAKLEDYLTIEELLQVCHNCAYPIYKAKNDFSDTELQLLESFLYILLV